MSSLLKRTNPIGVRFDPDKLEFIKTREKIQSNQQVVDLLVNKYWWEHKMPHVTSREAPPLELKNLGGITKENNGEPTAISDTTKYNLGVLKSFEQWKAAKTECENEEDWEKIKAGIESATNLSRKQKDLLIKYA